MVVEYKRFVGLGIDWWNKYRTDFFFRTQFDIVVLQIIFTLVVFAVFIFVLRLVEQNITQAIGAHITQIFTSDTPITEVDLQTQLQQAREQTLLFAMAVIVGITGLFGFIIIRTTLSPARNLLDTQKRFVRNIAHELRTPLSVLRTNTDIALLDTNIPKDTKNIFESNLEELKRISEIINNLLSLSAVIDPKRIRFEDVDLNTVAKSAVKKLSSFAKEKRMSISIHKKDPSIVRGNPAGLEQIAINVLRNAILYTKSGGSIRIDIMPDYQGNISLSIQDSGVGMSRKELYHVFEPFYRTSHARTRKGSGSGLGLTIVNEITKLHRGQIRMRSVRNKGTTIIVSLPAGEAPRNTVKNEGQKNEEEIFIDYSRNQLFNS